MSNHALYPLFVDLADRPVLIVGGGTVALRKAAGLLEAGARVSVVSPEFAPELESMGVTRVAQAYSAEHMRLSRWRLVFAATNAPSVNEAVGADAAAAGILCCRCDDPSAGDFVGGATGSKGAVTLAVSTGKASPVIAARIRDHALAGIDPVLVAWIDHLAAWRQRVLAEVGEDHVRRDLLKRLASAEMEHVLRSGGVDRAEALFREWLKQAQEGIVPESPGGTHVG